MSIPATQKAAYVEAVSETPDAIIYGDVETPQITSPTDIIVKNKYSGVNFIEAYFRKGIYPAQFPFVFGRESSGVVAAVGDKVSEFKVGDKVVYLSPKSFAQYTKVDLGIVQLKKLPASTTDEELKVWGALLVQGLTAITFAHESYAIQKGDYILVWAAAGGVGQILTQYASSLGAHVIAVASSDAKLKIAKELGAEFLVKLSEDVVEKVKEITGGKGVAASFDSIGKDTFEASLAALARKGTLVSFGNASGVVPPLSINRLTAKNVKVLRPTVFGYIATKEEWEHYTDLLSELLNNGTVKLTITTYPLSQYKEVATALEDRKTTGKLVLEIPQ